MRLLLLFTLPVALLPLVAAGELPAPKPDEAPLPEPTTTCPKALVEPPSWALSPRAPMPHEGSLTGQWMAVASQAPAGPLKRQFDPYQAIDVLTLRQRGDRVVAVWFHRPRAQGVRATQWTERSHAAAGAVRDGRLHLDGHDLTVVHPVGGGKVKRICKRVSAELTVDSGTGHLVGTLNGVTVRFAPLVVVVPKGPRPIGPPPPGAAQP